jgi:Arc/MetJ family transcription regulator
MAMMEYEINIDDALWTSVLECTDLTDPSEIVSLALYEMLDRLKEVEEASKSNVTP